MEKAYYDKYDIMKRYGCGMSKAYSIIRCVHHVCGGSALGKGKVLPSELAYWEEHFGKPQLAPPPAPEPPPPPKPEPQYIYRSVMSPSSIVCDRDGNPQYIRKQIGPKSSTLIPIKTYKEKRK